MRYVFLSFCLMPLLTFGQISALQSKAGETAVLIKGNGIYFNTGDASLGGSFSRGISGGGKTQYVGINFKAKSTGGTTTIFKGGGFKPEFDISGYFSKSLSGSEANAKIAFGYVLINYSRGRYNILKDTLSTEFNERFFEGLFGTVGYYRYGAFNSGQWLTLVAGSASAGDFNNTATLDDVDQYSINTSTTGKQTNLLYNKTSGLSTDYKAGFGIKLNIDAYIFPPINPSKNIGIGGFFRDTFGDVFNTSNIGIGVLVNKPKDVNTVSVGLFYQFLNVFGEKPQGVDQSFSISAGYNF